MFRDGGQEMAVGGPSFPCGFCSVGPKELSNVPEPWGTK